MLFENKLFFTFLCHSFHYHLPQALALDQRFKAFEVHEQMPVKFCNYLRTTDHEANTNFRGICNCYATAQIKLCDVKIFLRDAEGCRGFDL